MARTTVQSELIATNAISGTIIADGAITSTHLAANCVDTAELVTGSIDTIHIAANNVTAAKIVSDGIETRHLHSNVISAQSAVTAASGDYVLIGDTSDSNNLKKALVSDFVSDGITASGSDTIIQSPDDTSILYVNNSGKVGIGTAGPDSLLHLKSGNRDLKFILADSPTTGNVGAQIRGGSGEYIGIAADGTGIGLVVDDSNNVGIGTTGPDRHLHIETGGDTYLRVSGNRGNADDLHIGNIEFENTYGSNGVIAEIRATTGSSGTQSTMGQLGFYTDDGSAYAKRMHIVPSGNIGMPEEGETHTRGGIAKLGINSTAAAGASISIHRHYDGAFGGYLVFQKSRNTTKSNQDVVSDNDILGSIEFQGTDGNGYGEGAYIRAYVDGTPGDSDMPTRLTFATSNDGTSSPAQKLQINHRGSLCVGAHSSSGCIEPSGLNSGSYQGITFNSPNVSSPRHNYSWSNGLYWWNGSNEGSLNNAGTWTNGSDIAFKKNVADIEYGLSTVLNLQPRKYQMKIDDANDIGFIAQEMESIIPEIVHTNANNGYKSLDYGAITAVLVKAVQELKTELDAAKARITTLEG